MSRRRRAIALGATLAGILLVVLAWHLDRSRQQRSFAQANEKLFRAESNVEILATANLSASDFHTLCEATLGLADSALGHKTLRGRALRVRFRVHAARLNIAGMKREIAEMVPEGNAKPSIDMLYSFLAEV